jgi:hypothetical protein
VPVSTCSSHEKKDPRSIAPADRWRAARHMSGGTFLKLFGKRVAWAEDFIHPGESQPVGKFCDGIYNRDHRQHRACRRSQGTTGPASSKPRDRNHGSVYRVLAI